MFYISYYDYHLIWNSMYAYAYAYVYVYKQSDYLTKYTTTCTNRCAVGNSGYKRQLCKDKYISFVDMYMYSFYQTGIFVTFGGTSVKRRG